MIGPADNIDLPIARDSFDCVADFLIASDGDGQLNVEIKQARDSFRSFACSGVDHVENVRTLRQRSLSIPLEIGELGADGKSEDTDFFWYHSAGANDGRTSFVGQKKIISRRTIPNRVDRNGISNNGDVLAARGGRDLP